MKGLGRVVIALGCLRWGGKGFSSWSHGAAEGFLASAL